MGSFAQNADRVRYSIANEKYSTLFTSEEFICLVGYPVVIKVFS